MPGDANVIDAIDIYLMKTAIAKPNELKPAAERGGGEKPTGGIRALIRIGVGAQRATSAQLRGVPRSTLQVARFPIISLR